MEQTTKTPNRKKFLLWSAAILSSFTVLNFFSGNKKKPVEPVGETVKMLTQDGRLVVIDKKLLASSGKKVTTQELQQWIKK
jgi:hypothetical protein